MSKIELEQGLIANLRELTQLEQNEISVLIAIYSNHCDEYRKNKEEDFIKSIEQKIQFYGRKKSEYDLKINEVLEKYNNLIEQIIVQYNTRMMTIMSEINETEMNQKTAIVNMKISIDNADEYKIDATKNQKNNYEIVLQECFRQADNCWTECQSKLDEIFYNKSNQLAVKSSGILQKLINIFTGKKNIDKFVFESLEVELKQLQDKVNLEIEKIEEETLKNITIIKDAQIQTKTIFKQMLER